MTMMIELLRSTQQKGWCFAYRITISCFGNDHTAVCASVSLMQKNQCLPKDLFSKGPQDCLASCVGYICDKPILSRYPKCRLVCSESPSRCFGNVLKRIWFFSRCLFFASNSSCRLRALFLYLQHSAEGRPPFSSEMTRSFFLCVYAQDFCLHVSGGEKSNLQNHISSNERNLVKCPMCVASA